ncbi:MAG: glycosyltransferase [Verrucomicrobia bacterium]|nr:glycosyltransferase [Verrucomicrobiota bacterium]MDE3099503.1 glycosyltransferase [Verrucomicrobiota bacterium]
MISFIVPAHNEQACLGRTLQAIHESARAANQPYEIIVADDASMDATAEVARQNNARVLSVNHRQIAATRNSGAKAARGERLFFVDADTIIHPQVVIAALRHLDKGTVGGGAPARFDSAAPLYAQFLLLWFGWWMRLAGIAGGAFQFCTRDAFQGVGGFDERLFGGEDALMSWALKREGRFVVLWQSVVTSGRRMQGVRGLQMLGTLVRAAFFPKTLRQQSSVKKIWYDSNRAENRKIPDSLITQGANVFLSVITIVLLTNPFFSLFPQLRALIDRPLGGVRFAVNILLCHLFLVLWPCAGFLLRNLFQQTRWLERIKIVGLIALCLWFAWSVTRRVIWFWPWLYQKAI